MLVENVNGFVFDCLRLRGCFIVFKYQQQPVPPVPPLTIPIDKILSICGNYIIVYNEDRTFYKNINTDYIACLITYIDDFNNIFAREVIYNPNKLNDNDPYTHVDAEDVNLYKALYLAQRQRYFDMISFRGPYKYSSVSSLPESVFLALRDNRNDKEVNFESPYEKASVTTVDDETVVRHYESTDDLGTKFVESVVSAKTEEEIEEMKKNNELQAYQPNNPSYVAGKLFYPTLYKQVVERVPIPSEEQRAQLLNAAQRESAYITNPHEIINGNPVGVVVDEDIDDDGYEIITIPEPKRRKK